MRRELSEPFNCAIGVDVFEYDNLGPKIVASENLPPNLSSKVLSKSHKIFDAPSSPALR